MPEEPTAQPENSPFPPDDPRVWFHVVLTTYGAWLPGDPRGFRTRHHREHVEGDYKSPPPEGRFATLQRRSERLLKEPPVVIPVNLRAILGRALLDRLEDLDVFVLSMAVAAQHTHLQIKTEEGTARHVAGLAKKHAWFVLREHGWTGRLYGKRGKEARIRNHRHQVNTVNYIVRHEEEGAWVYRWVPPVREVEESPGHEAPPEGRFIAEEES